MDLNRARFVDLVRLPGVGRGLAQRIVEARERQGGFNSANALLDVRGIGPATLEKLTALVEVKGEASRP
jgi:competence protein ComEA